MVDSAFPCMESEIRGNTGNFLAALQMIANHDDICMGQERLSSLALMHIHYQVKIDLDEVVKLLRLPPNTHGGWSSGQS